MTEYMYNIFEEEAVIKETENGITIEFENERREFKDYDKAVEVLERMGYRF